MAVVVAQDGLEGRKGRGMAAWAVRGNEGGKTAVPGLGRCVFAVTCPEAAAVHGPVSETAARLWSILCRLTIISTLQATPARATKNMTAWQGVRETDGSEQMAVVSMRHGSCPAHCGAAHGMQPWHAALSWLHAMHCTAGTADRHPQASAAPTMALLSLPQPHSLLPSTCSGLMMRCTASNSRMPVTSHTVMTDASAPSTSTRW